MQAALRGTAPSAHPAARQRLAARGGTARRALAPPARRAAAAASGGGGGGVLASPEQQAPALAALAALHGALGAATTLAPAWSMQLLGFAPTPAPTGQLQIAGAYCFLIVSCLLCLKDAALHGRLGSDTYKRLGLGVMYQCVVFAVLLAKNRTIFTSATLGVGGAVFLGTALVAARVYAAGTGGFSLPAVVRGFAAGVADLARPKTLLSGFYALCAALALYQFFWQFPAPGTPLFLLDEGAAAVMLKQARGGGMLLAGVVWATLKDAADRGRLAASTFRTLNLAMALVAALQLWGYWSISSAGVPCVPGLLCALLGTGVLTVVVCDAAFFLHRKRPEAAA
ncbi:hypothetical protein HT031_005435 [Scenedesmus sp. PABB004]|nr:hypothetical protein HT031_005435 [Scenedesmus sp. PABB004]